MKKNKHILYILLFAFFGALLFGCKHSTIEFYRESKANSLMQKFSNKKAPASVKSGIIILKDDNYNESNINFGPRDIIFDMPMKLK